MISDEKVEFLQPRPTCEYLQIDLPTQAVGILRLFPPIKTPAQEERPKQKGERIESTDGEQTVACGSSTASVPLGLSS